jgi:methyl-accepting chemotaxis protein
MSRFALRVFLLAWALMIVTVVLTILASGWLPPPEQPVEGWPFDHRPHLGKLVRPGSRLLLIGISLLVSAAGSFVLARFVIRPVRRLREAGQRVAEGDLTARVASTVGSRRDDIAELARDFDTMTERVQALLESQQRLMRDVSHELRSPLARLQALLSIARQKLDGVDGIPLDRMEHELELGFPRFCGHPV